MFNDCRKSVWWICLNVTLYDRRENSRNLTLKLKNVSKDYKVNDQTLTVWRYSLHTVTSITSLSSFLSWFTGLCVISVLHVSLSLLVFCWSVISADFLPPLHLNLFNHTDRVSLKWYNIISWDIRLILNSDTGCSILE